MRPEVYTPVRQQTDWNQLFVMVRSDGDAAALLPSVRDAVKSLDPEQPIYLVRTLETAVAEASFQQSLAALLLSIFAAVALVLAAVGIFGVLSYTVSARTQEIGVRIAVGAEPRHVRWLVVRQVLVLTGVGLAIGTGILLAGGRVLTGLLFGVRGRGSGDDCAGRGRDSRNRRARGRLGAGAQGHQSRSDSGV